MATQRRFPLHWVFKIGNLEQTMRFYEDVFGMKLHRNEEFGSGCEATCNGPYGGAWTKTMVGYGTEITNTALELTYNYGVDTYELGNDYRYIAIAARDFGSRGIKGGFNVTPELPGGYQVATSPDGYRFLLVPGTQGCNADDPFLFVSLNVTNLATSVKYYTEALGFKIFKDVPGALNTPNSAVVGFEHNYFKIELVELEKGVVLDHKKGIGRLAIETDDDAPIHVAEKLKDVNGKIIHGPFKLPPHDEHVVIVADPDGYEYCFVGMTGYRAGSLSVTTKTIDWEYRKKMVAAATTPAEPTPSPQTSSEAGKSVVVVNGEEQYKSIKQTQGKLVVIEYSAPWCAPCKKIAPQFEALAQKYKDQALLCMVNIDTHTTIEEVSALPGVPAFRYFKNGEVVASFEGANAEVIESNIKKFL